MNDEVATAHDVQWTPSECQRLVRLCLRSFGPSDTFKACPYDVVVSLLRALNDSHSPTPADIEHAAATLPATHFRPELTPTATKLYATLLRPDQPLGRSKLIERADISASSYDRRLSDVRYLERVSAVHVDGHRRWTVDDASTRTTTWEPPATVSSKRGDTTAPLVTSRQSTTPVRDSVPISVRGRCSHGDTATATALDGKTVHQTVRLIEPDSERIVWSTHIPVPSRT